MKIRMVIALALLCALLLVVVAVVALNSFKVTRQVVGGGGGHLEQGGYALDGTIGQAAAGTVGDAAYALCSGFWCEGETARAYLPLVGSGTTH